MREKTKKKKLHIDATVLFERNRDAKTRYIVNEGGSRSSKTYSILQLFITRAYEKTGKEYDIVRETLPALKATAMKDFFQILESLGLYHEENHNKSDNSYKLNGNTFNFYSIDDAQKIRGRKRHVVLINEANEITLEDFRQLEMRTEDQLFLDYNPSQEEHWIYDHVIPRQDCTFIQSTYRDNPFLPDGIIKSIESYQTDDPEYWKIYGLGQRGKRQGMIYPAFDIVDDIPVLQDTIYGMDFGYNDPKVVVQIARQGKDIWIDELFYRSDIIREDFIGEIKKLIPPEKRFTEYYADAEDPESIEAIYQAGFNIHPADKGRGSVLFGIEEVRSYHLHFTKRSVNVIRDFRNYKWKTDKNGKALDEPVHSFSHAPDAVRYAVHSHWGRCNFTDPNAAAAVGTVPRVTEELPDTIETVDLFVHSVEF